MTSSPSFSPSFVAVYFVSFFHCYFLFNLVAHFSFFSPSFICIPGINYFPFFSRYPSSFTFSFIYLAWPLLPVPPSFISFVFFFWFIHHLYIFFPSTLCIFIYPCLKKLIFPFPFHFLLQWFYNVIFFFLFSIFTVLGDFNNKMKIFLIFRHVSPINKYLLASRSDCSALTRVSRAGQR